MSTTSAPSKKLEISLPSSLAQSRVVVAVSAGLDSACLLHLLARHKASGMELLPCHIDHGIRSPEDSSKDIASLQKLCGQLGLPLKTYHIRAGWLKAQAAKQRLSLEDLARAQRYQRLRHFAHLEGAEAIALAQHQDDQVEGFFLRLLEGSGPLGLSGMAQFSQGLWRPLLPYQRCELEAYAQEQQVPYEEDMSNYQQSHRRNILRWQLLPQVRRLFPQYRQGILRSQAHLNLLSSWLEEERCKLQVQIRADGSSNCWQGNWQGLAAPLQVELFFLLYDQCKRGEQRKKRLPLSFILEVQRQWLQHSSLGRKKPLLIYGRGLCWQLSKEELRAGPIKGNTG